MWGAEDQHQGAGLGVVSLPVCTEVTTQVLCKVAVSSTCMVNDWLGMVRKCEMKEWQHVTVNVLHFSIK